MQKKILAICAALVVFGLVPAGASASSYLASGGTQIAAGKGITGTSTEKTKLTSSAGTVECDTSVIHGTVTQNAGKVIEGDITEAFFHNNEKKPCSGAFGSVTVEITSLPWCIKQTKTTNVFEVRGGTCGEAAKPLTFTLQTGLFGTCKYERTTGVTGNGVNVTAGGVTNAHLTVSKSVFNRVSGFCPATGELDFTFKLETSDGTPVTLVS